jgi:hypothetical protein
MFTRPGIPKEYSSFIGIVVQELRIPGVKRSLMTGRACTNSIVGKTLRSVHPGAAVETDPKLE